MQYPKDKRLHLSAGLALSILAGHFAYPMFGLLIAAAVGALKEIIWDWLLKKGTPEFLDFVATVAGVAPPVIPCKSGRRGR